jgi:hypothetical protein
MYAEPFENGFWITSRGARSTMTVSRTAVILAQASIHFDCVGGAYAAAARVITGDLQSMR